MPNEIENDVFIKPFESRLKKYPVPRGSRSVSGTLIRHLDDVGLREQAGHDAVLASPQLLTQLKWDIAHRNYRLLLPCISINGPYQAERGLLPYTVDLYGQGNPNESKTENLFISPGDDAARYRDAPAHRRRQMILCRIALANVGLLTPHVRIKQVVFDRNDANTVIADYEITC